MSFLVWIISVVVVILGLIAIIVWPIHNNDDVEK